MFFLLLVPSVLLVFYVFYIVSECKIPILMLLSGIAATYLVVLGAVLVTSSVPLLAEGVGVDAVGNIAMLLCVIVFSYLLSRSFALSMFHSLFTVVISMIGNTAVGIPVLILLDVDVSIVRDSLALHLVIVAMTFPLCYVIAKYVGKVFQETSNYLSYEVKDKYVVYCLILSVITYVLALLNIFAHRVIADYNLLSSINIILISIFFFVAMYVMSAYSTSQQKILAKELEIKAQKDLEDYIQHLGEAYEEIRSFRHDHINLLHTIMGFVDDVKHAELKGYLINKMEYSKEALKLLDSSMDKLMYIHVPELRGMLWVKFAHALEHGISLEIDISKPVKDFFISSLDLCRFVGIIVDNSIEELLHKVYTTKIMKFGIITDDDTGDILIVCSNPCMVKPDIDNLFSMGYSTKDGRRGAGLYSLKKFCDKQKNAFVMTRYHDNNFTIIFTIGQV